jgi:superoxide dismutase, Fe-Mn family
MAASHAAFAGSVPAPRETGLSFEGLLKGEPGFQPRTPMELAHEEIPGFLSRAQLAQNYTAYRHDFANLVFAERALARATRDAVNPDYYARLRAQQVEAANSVLLHELYFHNLAARPPKPSGYVLDNMTEHMGSMESWRDDFVLCAHVAPRWAVLVYDPYDDRWHNLPVDDSSAGGWIGANPLLACDVAEHAWKLDYPDRAQYVARFMDHVDWQAVATRYRAVDRH